MHKTSVATYINTQRREKNNGIFKSYYLKYEKA